MSDKYANYEKLQAFSEDIRISWINDRDKTETMENLIVTLEQIVSKSSLEEYFENDEKTQNYFMNDFIRNVITYILKQPYVHGKNGDDIALNLLFQIYKLFYKFYNKNYPYLFENIRNIFKNIHNMNFFFPQNTINKSGLTNEKKKYDASIFNDMKCKDFISNNKYDIQYLVGEKVDILVNHRDSRTTIDQTAWVRGIIKKIENGLYYIEYNGEDSERTFPIGSSKVQAEGKKTNDWDWRTNLKKYDLVDVFDRDEWWPGTICDIIEENDKNGIKRVRYRIGFRLYLEHFNNKDDPNDSFAEYSSFWTDKNAKVDDEGQEYIGDDKEKDEEMYHFSKRIQKFNTYSETQKQCREEGDLEALESIKEELKKDDIIEDNNISNNFLLYKKDNKKNIIIGKFSNNYFSFYYALLLKRIEKIGDFDKYIKILNDKPNFEEIFTIFTILNSSIDYIHEEYFEENYDIIKKSFFQFINNLNDKEIKILSQDLVDIAKKFLTTISKYSKNKGKDNINKEKEENSFIEEEISLLVIFTMIKTTVFDKRLQGVKDLNDRIIKAQNDEIILKRIAELIKQHKLVNEIFGPNYHTQIISKSKDIVKLLLKYNQIDEEQITLIWACTQRGDYEAKITIINLFIDLIPNLTEDFIGKLLNAIISITDGKANEKEIDFMYKLSLMTRNPENKLKICQYFCQSIFKLTTFSMKNPVFEKLIELMRNDENYIIKALEICQQSMKENKYTLICNSLILSLIAKFTISMPSQNPPFHSDKDSLTDFLIDEHLLKIFEDNFSDYMKLAKEKKISQNLANAEQLIIDNINHEKNINGRIAFLLKLVDSIYPNYDCIWKIKELLLDNPVFEDDKKYFYRFCEKYCFSKEENETKNKAKKNLFNIFAENPQTKMNYSEFKLFIEVFIYLNASNLELNICKNYEDEEYIIKIKENIKDDEIKGIQKLWKILFEVEEENVTNKLINIIYQIVQDKKTIINNIVEIIGKEEDGEKIQKCYNLLKLFLIESEKNIFIDIKSHYSLLKNFIIKFPLELKNENNNQNITELFYDNTSLNEVKEVLMKKYKVPLEYIETNIKKDGQEFKLDHTYNNKSLKEIFNDILKSNPNQKIQFNKILIFSKIKKEREDLKLNNELTPKFKNVLKNWFNELTEKTEKMDKKYCTNFFLMISNNTEPSHIQRKVDLFFNKYDQEEKGYLSEDNFYNFYSDYLKDKRNIENAWYNLKNLGYNEYLIRNDEDLKVNHVKNNELYRFRLSVEAFINETIDNYNSYSKSICFDLLFFLPTNIDIYDEVLFNFFESPKIYDNIFKNDLNKLLQLYYLIIIESFLQDIEVKYIDPTQIFKNQNNSNQILCSKQYEPFEKYEIDSKKAFLEDFIKKKYYEKLIKYIIDTLNKYKKDKNDDILKKCFRKGLQIIKIIFEACLDNTPKNENLIEDNIYYIDYSHIHNELKDKKDIKDKVLNYSYNSLYKNLLDYILDNNNKIDELYNDCFDTIIKLLAFKENILEELFSNEKTKQSLYNLIINSLTSNTSAIIKSLTNTLKKLTCISSSSDNKFFQFLYDIMKPIFDSMPNNENKTIFLSNEFFEFFTQINDCIYKMKKDPDNKLIIMIVEMLINNINESNDEKKLSNDVFIKYMELILKLIKKNEKIKQQITSFKINDESLSSALLEKVLLGEIESNKEEKEDDLKNLNPKDKFISIDKKDNEDNDLLNKNLKEICTNYILGCFQDENDINSQKELIRINRIIKEKKESIANNINNSNKINSNNNKINTMYSNATSRKVCGHVGLNNLGATCYMNSIMQQLYMVPTFRFAIMGADDKDVTLFGSYNSQDDNLLHQLQVMYTYLTLSEKKHFNPKYFCHSFKDFSGNPTNPKVQQDSQEFYNNFCEQIENKLKDTKYKYIINDVFMGKTCSSVICDRCQHISNRLEDFYNLQLEVKNIKSLNDSLQKLIIPETIDGFKCEGCNKVVTIQKRTTLCKLPNTLIIHLKRFFMNYDYNVTEKINSRFEFPPNINLKNYCVENFQFAEDNNQNEIYYKNEEYYEYILKGVNVHLGHANGGHYISFIDVERDGKGNTMIQKKQKPIWIKFNDSQLSEYDYLDISNDCYGGEMKNINMENSQNAYLLIYERVKKTPIKVLMEEKNISKDNKIINYKKEEENMINKKYDISKRNNDIKEEELYKIIFHNDSDNEYYKYIPFYDVPKMAPKEVYKQIMEENKAFLKKNNNENNDKNIILDEEFQNKFKASLNSIITSPNLENNLKLFTINEQKDLINLLLSNIFETGRKDNLSKEEKVELNEKMEQILTKVIKPLINENVNIGILEYISKSLISDINIEMIFRNDNPVFNEMIVNETYELIIKLIEIVFYKNRVQLNSIFEVILKYLLDAISKSSYNGNNPLNPIKYIYKIILNLIEFMNDLAKKGVDENLIFILISKIDKENSSNQDVILNILKILLKCTEDFNKLLFPKEYKENNEEKTEFKDKKQLKKLFNYKLLELFFERDNQLLFMLVKILQYEDINFSTKFNIKFLPSLMEFAIQNSKLIIYLELCYNIIDIKDEHCLERMKLILGFPTMIIKPLINNENNNKENNNNQKWPLFGAELIKNNNNDLKTEIYKYISCSKNKFCILSYLLPYEGEKNENTKRDLDNMIDIKSMIYQLILKCLLGTGNYFIFKYLYLIPARSLDYKNAYEELISNIKDKSDYNMQHLKNNEEIFIKKTNYEINEILKQRNPNSKKIQKIEKPELPKDIEENNPKIESMSEFIGYNPDFIPGEIVKKEFQVIARNRYLEILRIEYFTKFYDINYFKNSINAINTQKNEIKKDIDNNEILNEKEKTIKIDISNEDYQKDEYKLIHKILKKFGKSVIKFIIEDGLISNDEDIINPLVRYILINKKPFNNKMEAYIKFKKDLKVHIKNNMCAIGYLYDYVERHNYVDFLDINRIRKDENFLQKEDIYIRVDSKAYINK